ncbi:DUF4234 domain-containing protein [Candidatus Saccharibacteria bacterium]|nr:DUF4234 domain-containing protein [Candidatus Saccharibacteria bacterium]
MKNQVKQRNPIAVFLLPCVTFGIYALYWMVKTKGELNRSGADKIPTAWLLIVPIANIWWLWKYSQGAAKVTNQKYSDAVFFILLFLTSMIGMAITQDAYNKTGAQPQ